MNNYNRNSRVSRRRLHQMIAIGVVTLVILIALIIIFVFGSKPANSTGKGTEDSETETQLSPEELLALQRAEMLANADALAVTYDYDGAIALIQAWAGKDMLKMKNSQTSLQAMKHKKQLV